MLIVNTEYYHLLMYTSQSLDLESYDRYFWDWNHYINFINCGICIVNGVDMLPFKIGLNWEGFDNLFEGFVLDYVLSIKKN